MTRAPSLPTPMMAEKLAKDDPKVDYRYHEVAGENCHTCVHMNPDGTCQRVRGLVKPKMVCNLWRRK